MTPTASIIIPAYNRADVMRYAILSVLQQSMPDWELIVVGDGCTDHSEEVVRSFDDPRISWENLTVNSGGQSAPINRGMQKARGDYLFVLGQDDLFFADRLAHSIEAIKQTGAQMLWSPVVLLHSCGERTGDPDPARDDVRLDGVTKDARFEPQMFMSATSWAMRRPTWDVVGDWIHADEGYVSPSQDWIFRVWRKGLDLRFDPHPSVLCIHAGVRKLAYMRTLDAETERAWEWIEDKPSASPELLRTVAICQAFKMGAGATRDDIMQMPDAQIAELIIEQSEILGEGGLITSWSRSRWVPLIRRFAPTLAKWGIHPLGMQRWIAGERRGHFVRNHRKFTHDVPVAEDGTLPIGTADGDRFTGFGWHPGDGAGRWTRSCAAELIFERPADAKSLHLTIAPLQPKENLRITTNGKQVFKRKISSEQVLDLPLPEPVTGENGNRINLILESGLPTTPHALGLGDEREHRGLYVSAVRFAG